MNTRSPIVPRPASSLSILAGLTLAAVAALVSPASAGGSHGYAMFSGDDGLHWALLGPEDRVVSMMWNDDLRARLDRIRGEDGELLWVRLDGREYVVTERSAIAEARALARPMMLLGEQQGRLGRTQGELGRKQGRLGREQGRIGALQGRLSAKLARADGDASGRRERDEIRRQLEELSAMQRELIEAQRPLARRQQELGARQQALGERQREASAAASRGIRRLAERCVEDGTARRLED